MARKSLPDDLLDIAGSPSRWSSWVTTDVDAAFLSGVIDALKPFEDDPVVAARIGHLLLLQDRPRESRAYLAGRPSRLCVAQAQLAQVRIADRENGIHSYTALLTGPQHFGVAENAIDFEAQMRLDYALGLAYQGLGSIEKAKQFYDRSVHIAGMIGVANMAQVVQMVLQRDAAERMSSQHAMGLGLLAVDVYAEGNMMLARDLVQTSLRLLNEGSLYFDIIKICQSWQKFLPVASQWKHAAEIICMLRDDPIEGEIDPRDPLLLSAHSQRLYRLALRYQERLMTKEARSAAGEILNLPMWPGRGERTALEATYVMLRVAAFEIVSGPTAALKSLNEALLDELHLVSPRTNIYFSLLACQLYIRSGRELAALSLRQAKENVERGLRELSEETRFATIRACALTFPSIVLALRDAADMPARIQEVISAEMIVLNDDGLNYRGAPLKQFPKANLPLIREMLSGRQSSDPRKAVTTTRYKQSLQPYFNVPVAFDWVAREYQQSLTQSHSLR